MHLVMLLTDLYDEFKDQVSKESLLHKNLTVQVPSKKWLLTKVQNIIFEGRLVVECRNQHIGSLVFLEGCDLINAMLKLFGKYKAIQAQCIQPKQKLAGSPPVHSTKQCLLEATNQINSALQTQARKLYFEYKSNPHMYVNFSIETFENQLDPQLVEFITALTQSDKGKKGGSLR